MTHAIVVVVKNIKNVAENNNVVKSHDTYPLVLLQSRTNEGIDLKDLSPVERTQVLEVAYTMCLILLGQII